MGHIALIIFKLGSRKIKLTISEAYELRDLINDYLKYPEKYEDIDSKKE